MSNYPVNRTDYTIVKGLGQSILFLVKDIDRVVVDGSTVTLTMVISDPITDTLLLQRVLVLTDPLQGLFTLQLTPLDTLDWLLGTKRYGVLVTRADLTQTMLWTDRNYTPYGSMRVIEGPIPGPALPVLLDPTTFPITDGYGTSSSLVASPYIGGAQTFAIYTTLYTGIVKVQATLQPQPDSDPTNWFDVVTQNFIAATGVSQITTTGNFQFMRIQVAVVEAAPAFLQIYPTPLLVAGTVDKVLAKC